MNIDQNQQNGSTEFLNFSDALNHLRWGEKIARRKWKGTYIKVVYGATFTSFRLYDYHGYGIRNSLVGEDIMAEDWYVV